MLLRFSSCTSQHGVQCYATTGHTSERCDHTELSANPPDIFLVPVEQCERSGVHWHATAVQEDSTKVMGMK